MSLVSGEAIRGLTAAAAVAASDIFRNFLLSMPIPRLSFQF